MRERAGFGLKATSTLILLFLHVPILLVFLYAFTSEAATFTFPPPGLTTKWFPIALSNPEMQRALLLSLVVALVATAIALVLGSLAAAAVWKTKFFGRRAVSFFIILPIALPGIITGIALNSAFNLANVQLARWTIIVGHATFCVAIAFNNVVARMRRTSTNMLEASADLGATGTQTFRHVLLPQLAPALVTGGMLAFALSFDEIIVTTFTAGSYQTLPIWLFSTLFRPRQRPVTNVVAMLIVAITTIPILLAQRFNRRAEES
jgi:putative spermidine/putrescine transport system permease protein